MRWSVVRLIAAREVRDQLRDRRTLLLILGLPILMYPLFVGVGLLFIKALKEKKLEIGVVGFEHQPKQPEPSDDLTPILGGARETVQQMRTYPPLLGGDEQFLPQYAADAPDATPLTAKRLDAQSDEEALQALLASRQVDAIVVIEKETAEKLERGERPVIRILGSDGVESSKLAVQRVTKVLNRWVTDVKAVRFFRAGKPRDFDHPIKISDPQSEKSSEKQVADVLRDELVKMIPILLVMWMLTGAIYPAIDMTAGEKERGTMETLLISPAERTEIAFGKFFATTCFGFGTAMWNVALMVVAILVAQRLAPGLSGLVSLPGLAACVLAAVPLAMLFAATALALGIFARSTKEGNYYMVPLFFVVLPLAFWTTTPGIELNGFTRWVPMANALLFQQRLMSVRPDPFPWQHVPAVFGTLALCVALALFATVRQFHREGVLFRESQGGGRKWSLFGRK